MVPLTHSCWRNDEGSVDLCVSALSGSYLPPFLFLQWRRLLSWSATVESQFHDWLTWFCPSCKMVVEEEMRRRKHWSINVYSALSGIFICLFYFNFSWALCPLWHEISMSQGPDWLWVSDFIWASVKQMKCFYLCEFVWVCVLILEHNDTKGNGCNHYQFWVFSFNCV